MIRSLSLLQLSLSLSAFINPSVAHLHPHDIARAQTAGKRQIVNSGGEGGPSSGPSSSLSAANYSCDATKCKLPKCNCASSNPPGGLAPSDVPQFVTFTADDAIEIYTITAVNALLAHRKNPNGCTPKMTYFTSLNYTNYSMVTDWYVLGNEIADHTMTHVGDPDTLEIQGNLKALNAFAGIPLSSVQGFRAPFLNYTANTLTQLHQAEFLYDSSASNSSPCNMTGSDCFWPYTLDYGLANDCLTIEGICNGGPVLPGLWEIPMAAVFDENQQNGVHLMDVWLDSTNLADVESWMKSTFEVHYNGFRTPFGMYSHPIHIAANYPGLPDPTPILNMLNDFLDWVQTHDNVWIVSNEQMMQWIMNPVPNSQIASVAAFGCSVPDVSQPICNGMSPNENGLLENCPFADFPWTTCYGCPVEQPGPYDPVPAQNTTLGNRFRLPANCSTPFWDPIKGQCLCTSASCQFTDQTRPIGNYTEGGTGTSSGPASASSTLVNFKPFGSSGMYSMDLNLIKSLVGIAGAMAMGAWLLI